MTLAPATLAAILLMALATYLTRIGGYLLLGNRTLSPRVTTVMDTAPGCVLISVIAPHFATGHPADLISLALTALAATRLSLLPTVLIGVASAGLLRNFLPV
ncbi:AzlD family protein [Shinella daejeonensis]|uniref:AzlD family protein n=1 Tax=Shinella daejeonensis TaxID=659017 RepID=UPI0020C7A900|nr:AzlD family protein [Shinella daejeonensis]MCP8896959.1 AzlD family protein [Shinella daejeonensis]